MANINDELDEVLEDVFNDAYRLSLAESYIDHVIESTEKGTKRLLELIEREKTEARIDEVEAFRSFTMTAYSMKTLISNVESRLAQLKKGES